MTPLEHTKVRLWMQPVFANVCNPVLLTSYVVEWSEFLCWDYTVCTLTMMKYVNTVSTGEYICTFCLFTKQYHCVETIIGVF